MVARRRLLLSLGGLALAGCGRGAAASEGEARSVALNGAGATFPFPLYSKWMAEYNRQNPLVRINYQSIGSGGGIRQVVAGTVDFGATDAPMKPEEGKRARGQLVHIPTTLGSVVVGYQLEGLSPPLRLTPTTLSAIFVGEITRWNDARLRSDNLDAKLPDQNITVIFRTDGSGTTAIFSEYLASVHSSFRARVGVGKRLRWPVGLGAKGNEGVAGHLRTVPGSIGYMELAYARHGKLSIAELKNRAGNFVTASPVSATAAAAGVEMPERLHVSLADPPGEMAYPIASYTYLLLYEDATDFVKGQALARFLWWALHDGQKFARELDYAPLPTNVVTQVATRLKQLRSGGQKLLV